MSLYVMIGFIVLAVAMFLGGLLGFTWLYHHWLHLDPDTSGVMAIITCVFGHSSVSARLK